VLDAKFSRSALPKVQWASGANEEHGHCVRLDDTSATSTVIAEDTEAKGEVAGYMLLVNAATKNEFSTQILLKDMIEDGSFVAGLAPGVCGKARALLITRVPSLTPTHMCAS
jgi:hypothetical protein